MPGAERPGARAPSPAIAAFLAMLGAERGAAANTLAAYARDLAGAEALLGDLEGKRAIS